MKFDEVKVQIDTDSDISGVKKHIHLIYKLKKRTIVLFTLALFLLVTISIYILYLHNSLALMQDQQREMQNRLLTKKVELKQKERAFDQKEAQYIELSERLEEIEDIIGVSHEANSTIRERSKSLKLTTMEMKAWLSKIPNGSPVLYKGVTSGYGTRRDPMSYTKKYHRGIDLRAKRYTKVFAPADGFVEFAGKSCKSGYGKLIILDHNYGFKTYYAHLSKLYIKNREFVKKGTLIALSGNTGKSSGPHLHYEIRFLQSTLNPINFIRWDIEGFYKIFKKERGVPWIHVAESIESDLNFKELADGR